MRYDAYYVVRGTTALAAALADEPGTASEVLGPLLLTSPEGGRSARTPAEITVQVKQLFAAYARHVLRVPAEVFGGRTGADAFDALWTIERFDGVDIDAETMIADLASTAPDDIPAAFRRAPT